MRGCVWVVRGTTAGDFVRELLGGWEGWREWLGRIICSELLDGLDGLDRAVWEAWVGVEGMVRVR